jgi:Ala-tRNA(Pro) deacylase
MRLDELLTERHVPYERLHHHPAYTANRTAQVLHVPGKEVAKTVVLRVDGRYVLAVLPATHRIDLEQIRQDLGAERVEMATEAEMDRLFPDCERGAVPPFGSLYQLETWVDEALAADERIVFDAQSHEDAIRMRYQDYEALEHPHRGHFARHP